MVRKTPESPGPARTSSQSILREANPEHSLQGPMLKLKLQYFGHLIQADDLLEKSLMLGKIEGRERRGCQKMIASWQESYNKPRQYVEKQRHYSADKGPYSQGYGLSSGHVWL